ncbi:hypothetical protein [Bacteroides sp.]|uniref:hypothetical protein n=1 Tax=Bacteroides sp. TaxID=29523 RepID=UPI00261B7BFB|nr:hypothetical protein [Bacteroides sp.]MDD3037911.1 hypothetical protein [Bacteroides sp.]
MKKLFKRLIEWAFSEELAEIRKDTGRIKELLGNMDVSVDVHHYSLSWAVISIQGEKASYIKFISLGRDDLRDIKRFLSQYDRSKVDCSPADAHYFFDDRFIKF